MRLAESLSKERDSLKAVEEVCSKVGSAFADRAPDLAFLFLSKDHADRVADLASEIRTRLGVRHLLGCTGEAIIGGGMEVESGPSLALWAASLPGVEVRTFSLRSVQTPDGFSFPLNPVGLFRDPLRDPAIILLAEPFSMPADVYLRRFNEDHAGVPVVGGMVSGGRAPGENVLLLDDTIRHAGAVGVLLSGPVRVRTVVSQGCRPIGKPYVVTDCDRNAIFSLGGKPAIQCVQEILARVTPEDRDLFQRAPHLGVVMNERKERFDSGDFLIRNVVAVDRGREAIFVSDCLRRGQTIQFHVRDGRTASEDLAALLEEEKRHHPDGEPRGGLVFGCNGRGTRLFSRPDHDISSLRERFGPVPFSGFFAQGEMGPVGGTSHLHGFTACVTLFSPEE